MTDHRIHKRNAPTRAPAKSGVALWRRIADELESRIAGGTYLSGSKLPGEVELADRLGVNRHTVRRAIGALAERGLVRPERGSGTYVETQRLAYPIGARTRFSEIIGQSGRMAGGRLVDSGVQTADRNIAKQLELAAGSTVIRIDALRHADNSPLCIATSWLPAERFPNAATVYARVRSMTGTLAHFGIADYRRRVTHVVAASADSLDARRLDLPDGAPILMVESVDVDDADKPILTTRARFAASRVQLVIET